MLQGMPRAFSQREQDAIRASLRDQARAALLAGTSVKRVSIDDLARVAGISKGAFYGFYPSKELLFLDVLAEVETAFRGRLLAQVRAAPADGVRILLDATMRAREQEPLLGKLAADGGEQLLRAVPEEYAAELLRADVEFTTELFGVMAAGGVRLAVDPDVFTGLMRGLFFLGLYREQIGTAAWPGVAGLLSRVLGEALVTRDGPDRGTGGDDGRRDRDDRAQ
jgi:AcrR family transcriptional regulator